MPEGAAADAAAIARPRAATSRRPSSKAMTPAAARAVYSPRECPAAAAGGGIGQAASASHRAKATV